MPGSGKQPPAVQDHIKELLEAGFDPTTIHKRLKVGRSSIYRMKRSLQQYGSAYAPPETNKKNGRPKVLAPEQELVIRDWLRVPGNRNRYLDDLVWYIHDQFGVVCSTTTVSKMKRKWLRVIEDAERNGYELPNSLAQSEEHHDNDDDSSARATPHGDSIGEAQLSPLPYPPPPEASLQHEATYPPLPHAQLENGSHASASSSSPPPPEMAIQPDLQQQAPAPAPMRQLLFDDMHEQLQAQIRSENARAGGAPHG